MEASEDDRIIMVFPQECNVRIRLRETLNIRLIRLPNLEVWTELEEP